MIPSSTVVHGGDGRRRPTSIIALLARCFAEDARRAWRHLILGVLAGSPLTPRVVRFLVYRMMGFSIDTANVWHKCTIVGSKLHIGSASFVNQQVFFEAVGRISVGRRCQIGMAAMILTSHHDVDATGASGMVSYRPVTIGDDVWLGARALVLPGVTIADRVVVAAGAVVSRDLDEPGVYAGVPARKIRDL